MTFQSTRPVRGATLGVLYPDSTSYISIHAPRAGRDLALGVVLIPCLIFQSTRPVRGATSGVAIKIAEVGRFQSTRPVRGATLRVITSLLPMIFQSTRPVRGATSGVSVGDMVDLFQSTRPVRGATSLGVA